MHMNKGVVGLRSVEDIIQHYGVKGMKWGVRRYQPYPKGSKNKGEFKGKKKQKKSVSAAITEKSKRKVSLTSMVVPNSPIDFAGRTLRRNQARRDIAKVLDSKISDFKRKDINRAATVVSSYTNTVLVTEDGKIVNTYPEKKAKK